MSKTRGFALGLLAVMAVATTARAQRAPAAPPPPAALRPYTPVDMLRLEMLPRSSSSQFVGLAPGGQTIAYLRYQAPVSAPEQWRYGTAADLWVTSMENGAPIKLMSGDTMPSSWFAPTWSPDGTTLAVLSYRCDVLTNPCTTSVWVWATATQRLTKVYDVRPGSMEYFFGSIAWLDARRIAIVVPTTEDDPEFRPGEIQSNQASAVRGWERTWNGRAVSVSVLQSGLSETMDTSRSQRKLVVVDVTTGVARSATAGRMISNMRPSPDGQHIAFFKWIGAVARDSATPDLTMRNQWNRFQVQIVDANGQPAPVRMTASSEVESGVSGHSFRWSPDGQSFAFIGRRPGADTAQSNVLRVFRGRIGGDLVEIPVPAFEPQELVWADGDRLLVLATKQGRADWWRMTLNGAPHNLTARLKTAPERVILDGTGRSFVGLVDGDLWRINSESGAVANLTATFTPRISSIVWPVGGAEGRANQIAVAGASADGRGRPIIASTSAREP